MTEHEDDALVEAVAGAHRHVDADGRIQPSPAFWDLDEDGRERAHARAIQSRALEAALDPDGLSSTGRRVLAWIRGSGRPPTP